MFFKSGFGTREKTNQFTHFWSDFENGGWNVLFLKNGPQTIPIKASKGRPRSNSSHWLMVPHYHPVEKQNFESYIDIDIYMMPYIYIYKLYLYFSIATYMYYFKYMSMSLSRIQTSINKALMVFAQSFTKLSGVCCRAFHVASSRPEL